MIVFQVSSLDFHSQLFIFDNSPILNINFHHINTNYMSFASILIYIYAFARLSYIIVMTYKYIQSRRKEKQKKRFIYICNNLKRTCRGIAAFNQN